MEITATRAGLVKALRALKASGRSITYSQSTTRWSGIDRYVCPNNVPSAADCSSFVAWIYWTAFGKGPDYLMNRSADQAWKGPWGNTDTIKRSAYARKLSSNPADWQAGECLRERCSSRLCWRYKPGQVSCSCAPAAGDLIFTKTPSDHVVIYLGDGEVASFGSTGPVQIKAWTSAGTFVAAYSFPAFFV